MANNIERVTFDLPADIIFDVLSRLPIKTLIRFKSVCKTWYALIESSNFVQTHEKMQPNLALEPQFNNLIVIGKGPGNRKKCSLLHFNEDSRNLIGMELSYLPCIEDCVVVGVCNGLVCGALSYDSPDLIICNPRTGQFRQTPEFGLSKREGDIIFLGFCLHVSGYDIIRIIFRSSESHGVILAELYTVGIDTWREIDIKPGEEVLSSDLSRRKDDLEAVLIGEVFYWKAFQGYGEPYIAYFDKYRNVFDLIDPPGWPYDGLGWELQELKEELAMIIYQSFSMFDLWVMNKDMDWMKIRNVDLSRIPCFPSDWDGEIRVIGSTRNGELVPLNRYADNLRLYDPISEETKCLHIVGFEEVIYSAYLYTLSLTPVN